MYATPHPVFVRFSDYHPAHHSEGYFYNFLLDRVPFRCEAHLLSPGNKDKSYLAECQQRGFINSDEVCRPASELDITVQSRAELSLCLQRADMGGHNT